MVVAREAVSLCCDGGRPGGSGGIYSPEFQTPARVLLLSAKRCRTRARQDSGSVACYLIVLLRWHLHGYGMGPGKGTDG